MYGVFYMYQCGSMVAMWSEDPWSSFEILGPQIQL